MHSLLQNLIDNLKWKSLYKKEDKEMFNVQWAFLIATQAHSVAFMIVFKMIQLHLMKKLK